MTRHYRTFDEVTVEHYRTHPGDIPLFIEVALEESEADGDWVAFLRALRIVAKAKGGMMQLAEDAELSRTSLYKTLSEGGNPRLETIQRILHSLGYRLSIKPIEEPAA